MGATALTATAVLAGPAWAAAPQPCGGVAQIADATGDGHHENTDVLGAWFSEGNGRLQAVIKVRQGVWAPAHDDSDAAGFSLLYEVGGVRRYVRAEAPRTGPVRFDQGTWTLAGGYSSQGATAGEVTTGGGATVTIDVPNPGAGAVLRAPFVMTYDGGSGADLHWVDRAPGGTAPDTTEVGADYVVGSCSTGVPGGPAPGGGGPSPGPGGGSTGALSSVTLNTPARLTGGGTARVSGRVVPATPGVTVKVTTRTKAKSTKRFVKTRADGTYVARVKIGETTSVDASAAGLGAQTRTITVRSKVTLTLRRVRGGKVRVSGLVSPKLPGRVLLLRGEAVTPTATTTARDGRFRIAARRLRPGRYEAVFIPSANRAERSTSKTGTIR